MGIFKSMMNIIFYNNQMELQLLKTRFWYLLKRILLPILILIIHLEVGLHVSDLFLPVLPGPIIGMLLLLFSLRLRIVPYEWMKDFSAFLVRHISFFLIPSSVSIVVVFAGIKGYLPRIMSILLISLIVVLMVIGRIVQGYERKADGNEHP